MTLAQRLMSALVAVLAAVPLHAAFSEEALLRGLLTAPDMLGVAWTDANGDTRPDLYISVLLPDGFVSGENRLYIQQFGGFFLDQADADLQNGGNGYGICFADIDNDADADLYLSNGLASDPFGLLGKENKLFYGDGAGGFQRAGASSGVEDVPSGRSAVVADYDRDGFVDLFVAIPWFQRDRLYRNQGDGTFVEVTDAAGILGSEFNANGAAWGDFDNDGWPDLFVANHGEPNSCSLFSVLCERDFLYRNRGDGTFEEIGQAVGLDQEEPSFGGSWGDYDNDGDLDLYVTNGFDLDLGGGTLAPNRLYHNLLAETGTARFEERAADAGLADPSTSFSANWADYDNDGLLDLFWTNAYDNGADPRNRLVRNTGPGPDGRPVFADVTDAELGDTGRGQGAAWADFNGDGFLDLVVLNIVDAPLRLYRNEGNGNHWLHVDTIGTDSNRDGIGARLTLRTAGGLELHREIYAGGGYLSQDSLEAELGLGGETDIASLEIAWPSGCVQTLEASDFGGVFPVDRRLEIVEDCSAPELWIYRGVHRDLVDLAPDPNLRLPAYLPLPATSPWTDPEAVLDTPELRFSLTDTVGDALRVDKALDDRSVVLRW